MTFLTLTPWSRRNAYDEDGRVWYEECISARFIRPVEEAVRAALTNADWDPLTPKGSKVKKVSAGPPRPSAPAMVASRVPAPPLARSAAVASTAAPSSTAASAPRATPVDVVIVEEEATVEDAAAAHMVVEEAGAAETTVEGAAAVEEVAEAMDAEIAPAEVTAEEIAEETAEEAAEGAADEGEEEAIAEAAEEATDEAAEEPAVDATSGLLTSTPRRPSGISIRSPSQSSPPLAMVAATISPMPSFHDSTVVAEPVVTGATVVSVPSLLRTTSAVMTDLSLPEATSSDDLEELYASLHEEGGSSASAPLDEDSKTVIERLREFLLLDVRQMTTAGAITEFRSCLDTAMALGLLDSEWLL
ncbi:uncharacterized protein LOC110765261, partial [Prunus avium]|uniref:Uncharacterized protein LOC110765261 n=1 Tax=Prunus avium TaxID=42229 RepID=A0A6P5TA65_PRUAV